MKLLYSIVVHSKALQDLRFIGQIEHGVYVDDLLSTQSDIIAQYSGSHGRISR